MLPRIWWGDISDRYWECQLIKCWKLGSTTYRNRDRLGATLAHTDEQLGHAPDSPVLCEHLAQGGLIVMSDVAAKDNSPR